MRSGEKTKYIHIKGMKNKKNRRAEEWNAKQGLNKYLMATPVK